MLEFLRNMFSMQRNRNERGASAVEYGLLVAGIAAIIVTIVFTLGSTIQSKFTSTCTSVKNGGTTNTTSC